MKKFTTFAETNTKNTMETIWTNEYKNGKLIASTPFSTMEEALAKQERIEGMIKALPFLKGHECKVEKQGSLNLFILNEWEAISANYGSKYRNDGAMRMFLYKSFGIDTKKYADFAKAYYSDNQAQWDLIINNTAKMPTA